MAAEHYHYGWSAEELLRQHPDWQPAEVYAALTYFSDRYDQMVADIESSATASEYAAGRQTLSRNELLTRPRDMSN